MSRPFLPVASQEIERTCACGKTEWTAARNWERCAACRRALAARKAAWYADKYRAQGRKPGEGDGSRTDDGRNVRTYGIVYHTAAGIAISDEDDPARADYIERILARRRIEALRRQQIEETGARRQQI